MLGVALLPKGRLEGFAGEVYYLNVKIWFSGINENREMVCKLWGFMHWLHHYFIEITSPHRMKN